MKISSRGLDLIKRFEGLRLKPYQCPAGVLSIGYGHVIKDPAEAHPITAHQAEVILKEIDLPVYEAAVNGLGLRLNQSQFDALVSLGFNVGTEALRKSTLIKKLRAGDIPGAADQFRRWTRAGGQVLPGLVRRREAERELFLEPVASESTS